MTDGCDISSEIALRWTSLDLSDMSTLVQVMAWCRQATSHYLNQCWPRSLQPYGVTRPQCVNTKEYLQITWKLKIHYVQTTRLEPWKYISTFFSLTNLYIFIQGNTIENLSQMWWPRPSINPSVLHRNIPGELDQYYGCWCPGSLHIILSPTVGSTP